MSIEAALIAALKANAGIAALAGTRVFIAGGVQGSLYPYVAVQRIVTVGAAHLGGPATLEWPLFQVDCWSTQALEALTLAEAVRSAIDSVEIAGAPTFTATLQDQQGPAADPETRNFRCHQDYHLFYER